MASAPMRATQTIGKKTLSTHIQYVFYVSPIQLYHVYFGRKLNCQQVEMNAVCLPLYRFYTLLQWFYMMAILISICMYVYLGTFTWLCVSLMFIEHAQRTKGKMLCLCLALCVCVNALDCQLVFLLCFFCLLCHCICMCMWPLQMIFFIATYIHLECAKSSAAHVKCF